MHSVLNGRYACDGGAMWNECPFFRKLHESGTPDDVYLRRLEQGMWAFNSHHPQHDHNFATASSKDTDKLRPQDVTSWKAQNADSAAWCLTGVPEGQAGSVLA